MEAANQLLFAGAILFVAAVLVSAWAFRFGAPLLLVFLVVGMLAGEDGPGGIRFDDYRITYIVGNIALAVILFDGGLRTRFTSFTLGFRPAMSLATLGVVVTTAITGAFAARVLGLGMLQGLLVGAIVGSTDAAAVFSLLRNQGISLKERVATVLEIESGSNDPMAIFLTVALVALLASGDAPSWQIGVFFLQQMGIGLAGGVLGGRLLAVLVNRIRLAEGLYPLLALAGGLFIFGLVGQAGGSGFLAIYAAGIVFGNRPVHAREDILGVHDGLAWLAQIVMFLVLGLLANPSALLAIAPAALLISAGMMFIARPLAVWLSLLAYRAPFAEKLFISWVGLRGAVPVVLALFPLMAGLENAQLYFNVAFFVVLTSLVFQGWTIAPLARLLRLELPPLFAARQRVALDIDGGTGFELAGYRLPPRGLLDGAGADELGLASDERLVAVFRDARPLLLDGLRLAGGDLVYVLARSENIDALSGRLAAPPLPGALAGRGFFGDFALDPAARLGDVCQAYGIAPPAGLAELSLAEVIARRFKGLPVVGDRVTLGDIDLVVRQTRGKAVAEVGLVLHPSPAPEEASA